MYLPESFKESDPAKLFDLIEQNSFGLLISANDGDPFASHLPLLLDRTVLPNGCLVGHMARANPQWKQLDGKSVLAVFSGPHAYISPTWYEVENVVPTWNYTAVHAYGVFRAVHDPVQMMEIARRYVDLYEAGMPKPWKLDTQSEYSKKHVMAIVGFRIEITRLEGKWKLNQNRPQEQREKVANALDASADENAKRIAALMRE